MSSLEWVLVQSDPGPYKKMECKHTDTRRIKAQKDN